MPNTAPQTDSTAALFARVNDDPDPDHFIACAECGHLHYNTAFKLYADCPLAPDCDCQGQDPIGPHSDLTRGVQ